MLSLRKPYIYEVITPSNSEEFLKSATRVNDENSWLLLQMIRSESLQSKCNKTAVTHPGGTGAY